MTPDPEENPVVEIDGKKYRLKFRLSDIFRLKKDHGIELNEPHTFIGAEACRQVLLMLEAAIAHESKLTFDDLSDMVEWQRMPEINIALQEAISKVSAQMIALQPRLERIKQTGEQLQAMTKAAPAAAVQ